MKAPTHQFHGRVRLRFSQLRGAPFKTGQVATSLRQIAGVLAVESSPATGSVLVRYEVGGADEIQFWPAMQRALEQHGLSCHDEPSTRQRASTRQSAAGRAAEGVVEKVADAFIGKLVERSAVALVAALL